jgi:adenylosuccinate synthase
MSNVVVVGTQWGDEGKGKIVDILTEQADIVVRFQGGPNAGHTVVVGDTKTILHQVPSGILNSGKQCIVGNGVVMDLETLLEEIGQVREQGYFTDPNALKISENANLIMPYHKKIDIAREKKKGKNKIGTTGRGIGPAYEDKAARNAIRFGDIFNDELLREKIETNLEEKNFYLSQYLGEEPLKAEDILKTILSIRDQLKHYVVNASVYLDDAISQHKKILFEGAQGTMLDVDHGTYPFVTSSNTVAAQASIGSGVGPRQLHTILGITKAYTTRVGEGPFPTELNDENGEFLRAQGGEFGSTTGRPRRCGWFDLVVVKHSIRLNSINCIALTKLDVLSGLDHINICTGYRCEGKQLNAFPTSLPILRQCEPIYETMPGWKEDISEVNTYADLPQAAQNYIARLEELTGVSMCMISVGVKRTQNIARSNPFDAE